MKVLAIASAGGHWIQLLRLRPAFEGQELIFVSTQENFADTVRGYQFYCLPDSNRKNKVGLFKSAYYTFKLVISLKPNVIITTGAAPGLMGILAGKFISSKTIWIDSIANVEKLSLSGKIAKVFADRVYTQWPHLATTEIVFKGNVLS